MNKYDKIVGRNLKKLREEIGFTQLELADFLDKPLHVLEKYEMGEFSMSISLLKYLSEQFEVKLDVFFEYDYTHKIVLFVDIVKEET